MDTQTQASLLERLRLGGDDLAWREFDRRYRDLVVSFARRRGLQATDADEIGQIVLLAVAKALPQFHYDRARGRFRDYLRTVTCRELARFLAERSEQTTISASESIESHERADAELEWEREWMAHHYRIALRAMRRAVEPRSVQVLELSLQGLGTPQIAERLAMSLDAVTKARQRLRDRIKQQIAAQVDEEG